MSLEGVGRHLQHRADEERWREGGDATASAEAQALLEFLANPDLYETFAALYGGLSFSVAALYAQYGSQWQDWVFQAVNVHYRYASFGLEAWTRWLDASASA